LACKVSALEEIPDLISLVQRCLSILLVLLSGSLMAAADSLTVGSPITGITLTVSDPALTSLGYNQVTAYIDPYQGTLNGNAVVLFCVDPDHFDGSGPYPVNVSSGGTGSSTEQVVYHGLTPTQAAALYGEEAYLAEELISTPASDALTRQEIQAAIWQLADPQATFPDYVGSTSADIAFNNALTRFKIGAQTATNIPSFEVLTDSACKTGNCATSRQEYLVLTPEPSSILLSFSGLAAVLIYRRRLRIA
jgi:hypothetical protein